MTPPTNHRNNNFSEIHPAVNYRPPAYLRNARLGLILIAITAISITAYVVFWFVAASYLREGAEEWTAARRAEGYGVGYSKFKVGGFPFHLRLTVEDPKFSPPGERSPWAWSGARVEAETRPWTLGRIKIRLLGLQRLTFPLAGSPVTYRGMADDISADLTFSGEWPSMGEVKVSELNFSAEEGDGRFAAHSATLHFLRNPAKDADYRTTTIDTELTAKGLVLPDGLAIPLGNRIDRLSLNADVMGRIDAGPWPRSLSEWRDAGGTIEVTSLHISYGPLVLWTKGTLALDGDMQLTGSFTAKVQGFFETVDTLRKQGLIRLRDAVTAKIVLGALSRKSGNGGPPTLNLALTLQDRKVFAGPVALVRLPAIEW